MAWLGMGTCWTQMPSFWDRYTILDSLGSGTFGQVVKVLDSATGKEMAVKVIKNRTAYFTQARVEVDILHKVILFSVCRYLCALYYHV